jgi:Flp pilus assembly protein TadB
MIDRQRKRRAYNWYEKAVMVLFCLLWFVLWLLNIGLAWYFAYPLTFGAGFLLLRWHYGRLRRIVRLEEE